MKGEKKDIWREDTGKRENQSLSPHYCSLPKETYIHKIWWLLPYPSLVKGAHSNCPAKMIEKTNSIGREQRPSASLSKKWRKKEGGPAESKVRREQMENSKKAKKEQRSPHLLKDRAQEKILIKMSSTQSWWELPVPYKNASGYMWIHLLKGKIRSIGKKKTFLNLLRRKGDWDLRDFQGIFSFIFSCFSQVALCNQYSDVESNQLII